MSTIRIEIFVQAKQYAALDNVKLKNIWKNGYIAAISSNHRAKMLVERLIQTNEKRKSVLKLSRKSNRSTINTPIEATVYQLRFCKQKNTIVSLFQTHLYKIKYTT